MYHFSPRPKWEGGQYEGDEHTRLETLHTAKELGADYIDFELKVVFLNSYLTLKCVQELFNS